MVKTWWDARSRKNLTKFSEILPNLVENLAGSSWDLAKHGRDLVETSKSCRKMLGSLIGSSGLSFGGRDLPFNLLVLVFGGRHPTLIARVVGLGDNQLKSNWFVQVVLVCWTTLELLFVWLELSTLKLLPPPKTKNLFKNKNNFISNECIFNSNKSIKKGFIIFLRTVFLVFTKKTKNSHPFLSI